MEIEREGTTCTSGDLSELCAQWSNSGRYIRVRYDGHYIEDIILCLTSRKDEETHIHIFFDYTEEVYFYQLKCFDVHCGRIQMNLSCPENNNVNYYENCRCDIPYYYDTFNQLLNDCIENEGCYMDMDGGSRKKRRTRKRNSARKSIKTRRRKTRRN